MKPSIFKRAFTLVEILGAAALIATLATVAVISVKDSVTAGQRASVQRELQGLNTTLSNFKSAGGVVREGATAEDALADMLNGTNLSGSNYAPLSSMPELTKTIGGVPYTLSYDPETGFSYVPSGEAIGEVFAGSGAANGLGANGESFPFDITKPDEMTQALAKFANMLPSDPNYQSYLAAFNAANSMNTLPAEDLAAMNNVLAEDLISVGGNWQQPSFDISDPAAVLAATQMLPSLRSDPTQYAGYIATLKAALTNADETLSADIQGGLWSELGVALQTRGNLDADWSFVDFTGKGAGDFPEKDFRGTNITAQQLSKLYGLDGLILSGIDMSEYVPVDSGISANGTDFSGTGIRGEQLNTFGYMEGANLSGLDLTGWEPVQINKVILADSNVTGAQLNMVGRSDSAGGGGFWGPMSEADFSRTNLQGLDMRGRVFDYVNFSGVVFDSSPDTENAYFYESDLSGSNFRGETIASGKGFYQNCNFNGTNVKAQDIIDYYVANSSDYWKTDAIFANDFRGSNVSKAELEAGFRTVLQDDPNVEWLVNYYMARVQANP